MKIEWEYLKTFNNKNKKPPRRYQMYCARHVSGITFTYAQGQIK